MARGCKSVNFMWRDPSGNLGFPEYFVTDDDDLPQHWHCQSRCVPTATNTVPAGWQRPEEARTQKWQAYMWTLYAYFWKVLNHQTIANSCNVFQTALRYNGKSEFFSQVEFNIFVSHLSTNSRKPVTNLNRIHWFISIGLKYGKIFWKMKWFGLCLQNF